MSRVLALLVSLSVMFSLGWAAEAAQKTNVRVWFAGSPEATMKLVKNELVPEFEKQNPNISLEVDFISWGDLSPKLTTSFTAGLSPDIFMHGQAATAGFAANGQVEPLDSYIASWTSAADFGATLNAGRYLGSRYLIPVYGSGRLLVYRDDFFRESGLDPAKPPQTWEELKNAAQKQARLRNNRLTREGIDLSPAGTNAQQCWAQFLWQNGGDFFNSSNTQAIFHQAAGIEAFEYYTNLIRDENISDVKEATASGNVEPIAAGTIAMSFLGVETLNQIEKYSPNVYPNVKVAPPLRRKEKAAWYSFAGWFMSKQSKNKSAAWVVIKYLSDPDVLAKIDDSLSGLPPRSSLSQASFIRKDARIVSYMDALPFANTNPNIPAWVKARDILGRYMEKAAYGQIAPADALKSAAAEINPLL